MLIRQNWSFLTGDHPTALPLLDEFNPVRAGYHPSFLRLHQNYAHHAPLHHLHARPSLPMWTARSIWSVSVSIRMTAGPVFATASGHIPWHSYDDNILLSLVILHVTCNELATLKMRSCTKIIFPKMSVLAFCLVRAVIHLHWPVMKGRPGYEVNYLNVAVASNSCLVWGMNHLYIIWHRYIPCIGQVWGPRALMASVYTYKWTKW